MGSLFGGSMIGKPVLVIGARRERKLQLSGVLSFGFLVDTASEPLPKRFGRQGLGHAKRKSTINGSEMSSQGEIREGQNKKKLRYEKSLQNIRNDPVRACLLCRFARNKGSSASCSAAGRVLPRVHNS